MSWPRDVAEVGTFAPATWTASDGEVRPLGYLQADHRLDERDGIVLVHVETPDELDALAPSLRGIIRTLAERRDLGVAEIVGAGQPADIDLSADIADALTDLRVETLELHADGSSALHFVDTCGEHFPDGYWPSARFDADGVCTGMAVES